MAKKDSAFDFPITGGGADLDSSTNLASGAKKATPVTGTGNTGPLHVAGQEERALQDLLRDVPCFACGHKGGKRVISTSPAHKADGKVIRHAACRRAACGFSSVVVQMPKGKPELAPDADQNVKALPPSSPRAVEAERNRIAAATAKAIVNESLSKELTKVVGAAVKKAFADHAPKNGNGKVEKGATKKTTKKADKDAKVEAPKEFPDPLTKPGLITNT